MADHGRYRIELNGEWTFEDLYLFPRAYEQVYFFFSSLDRDLTEVDRERIVHAYKAFPWRGGYSAINFFNQLTYATRRQARPTIIAIKKASPGFFDLGVWLATATALAVTVKQIASAIDAANTAYHNVYKGLQDRRLLRLRENHDKLEFDREQLAYISEANQEMSHLLGFASATELNKLTGDPYLTTKILLSVYRRVRTLCDYENKGKAHLTENQSAFRLRLAKPRKSRRATTRARTK
jgi:hypothetical protein